MTHLQGNLYSGPRTRVKPSGDNSLGDAAAIGGNRLNFAVEVDFQGQGCGVKHSAAVGAVAEVALDFAPDFGRQPTFEILADQADRSLAGHAHGGPPGAKR